MYNLYNFWLKILQAIKNLLLPNQILIRQYKKVRALVNNLLLWHQNARAFIKKLLLWHHNLLLLLKICDCCIRMRVHLLKNYYCRIKSIKNLLLQNQILIRQ